MSNFKTGDRVMAVSEIRGKKNRIGTIAEILTDDVLVDFGKSFDGHNGDEFCTGTYTGNTHWFVMLNNLEPVTNLEAYSNEDLLAEIARRLKRVGDKNGL